MSGCNVSAPLSQIKGTQKDEKDERDQKDKRDEKATFLVAAVVFVLFVFFVLSCFRDALLGDSAYFLAKPGEALNDLTRLPSFTFQIRTSPSNDPDAINSPSGLMATA